MGVPLFSPTPPDREHEQRHGVDGRDEQAKTKQGRLGGVRVLDVHATLIILIHSITHSRAHGCLIWGHIAEGWMA